MSQNHVLLETIQLTQSGVSSVVLDNIPQTGYTDLKVVVSARTTRTGTDKSDELRLKFNNITSGYSTLMIEANGSTTRTVADASGSYFGRGVAPADDATSSTFGNTEYYIPNYAGSTNKTISINTTAENNGTEGMLLIVSGLLTNTAAITSMTFTAVGTYDLGSTFSIYGIAELGTNSVIAPLASGGNIVANDGTYWYHAFLSSGTFTPAKALSCDVLVIAGGGAGGVGAGGGGGGGGGGAGGYLNLTAQSLLVQSYGVTVGAGGAAVSTTAAALRGTQGVNSQFGTLTAAVGGGGGGGADSTTTGAPATGGNGGSGGGATQWNATGADIPGGTNTSGQGFAGGNVTNLFGGSRTGAGGGGAGAVGVNANASTAVNGGGGAGSNANSTWASATNTGVSGFYAGGGGGSTVGNATSGGSGGGGGGITALDSTQIGTSATINTGSGGGGLGGSSGTSKTSGAGGSGIVIVRYPMV
jgi:hypothetical protein